MKLSEMKSLSDWMPFNNRTFRIKSPRLAVCENGEEIVIDDFFRDTFSAVGYTSNCWVYADKEKEDGKLYWVAVFTSTFYHEVMAAGQETIQ